MTTNNVLSDKENKLIDLLKAFPRQNHTDDEACGTIICIVCTAHENGWVDEFIRICEHNRDSSFDDILKLIFTEERFPPLEVIGDNDDDS